MVAREEDQARLESITGMSGVDAAANAGTTAVRQAYKFDEARLSSWMAENIEGFSGPLVVEQFKGGQSNPTYKLITPDRTYVLRRKPPGNTVKGAHAVDREVRVLEALGNVDYPVAHVYKLCTDEEVIGSWFYIMDMVEGRVFWDASFPNVSRASRPDYFAAMNRAIADLHNIDPKLIGLEDFGRTGNYFDRQISLWSKQYIADEDAGRHPAMDHLMEWLPKNIPQDEEVRIIHGDFRCDNMIFHPTEPRIVAVLDWELSTLGSPLADFAYHAMMFQMPPDIVAGLAGTDLRAMNIPSEEDYLEAYCRRTGRTGIPNWDFYIAFNFFRLAAIFHGIKGRVLRGTAASEHAKERAKKFPLLAALALQASEKM